MKDLSNPRWMWVKALLFITLGAACAVLVYLENPAWRTILFLGLIIWSFCRVYYFAFYVIEKYVDPSYKFSGLYSFVKYLLQRRR
jgi:hypothetical protein